MDGPPLPALEAVAVVEGVWNGHAGVLAVGGTDLAAAVLLTRVPTCPCVRTQVCMHINAKVGVGIYVDGDDVINMAVGVGYTRSSAYIHT